jgi:Gpi18-like mannosyltransferase
MKNILLLLVVSFVISNLFWLGGVDPDYYDFYYIGRGVAGGQNMFRDFADNKGPVLYLTFAGMYKVFGDNLGLALVTTSTFLDVVAVWLTVYLLGLWLVDGEAREYLSKWWVMVLLMMFYKSLTIGIFMGGVYAESIAFPLFLISLIMLEKKRLFWSGMFFALCVLTRQSFVYFAVFYIWKMMQGKRNWMAIGGCFAGGISVGAALILSLCLSGNWR